MGDEETIRYLKAHISEFDEITTYQPALDVVLAWKDRLKISDRNWPYTMDVFNLDDGLSVYYLSNRKKQINAEMLPESTGGTGYHLPLLKYMNWVLEHFPPPARKLVMKIAFDGATITTGKRKKQEIGTFDFLFDGLNLSQTKSIDNTHQFIIYLGNEDRETLVKELKKTIEAVDYLAAHKKLVVGSIEYEIDPVLVCDMACLVEVLGLYNCFCPQSHWKCAWCLISKLDLFNFDIETWPLRDLQEMQKRGAEADSKRSESTRNSFARVNYGIRGSPLFKITLDHIVPCMLHCFMAVMRKLLELLIEEAHHRPELQAALEDVFDSLHLRLPPKKAKGGKIRSLLLRVQKARFGRPDFLRILNARQRFLDCISRAATTPQLQEKFNKTLGLWNTFAKLTEMYTNEEIRITESEWKDLARPFGKRYPFIYFQSVNVSFFFVCVCVCVYVFVFCLLFLF